MISFTITNKHRPRATVVMLVSLYGKQYKKCIGVGVPIKYWNEKKKCARTTADYNGDKVNQRIGEWEQYGNKTVKYFTDLKLSPAPEEFARVLSEMGVEAEPQAQTYFCDYLEAVYIPRYTTCPPGGYRKEIPHRAAQITRIRGGAEAKTHLRRSEHRLLQRFSTVVLCTKILGQLLRQPY